MLVPQLREQLRQGLREYLLASLELPAQTLVVYPPEGCLQRMLADTPGAWLRRLLRKHSDLRMTAEEEFWNWVSKEKLQGFIVTGETKPARGRGRSVRVPEAIQHVGAEGEAVDVGGGLPREQLLLMLVQIRAGLSSHLGAQAGCHHGRVHWDTLETIWKNVARRLLANKGLTVSSYLVLVSYLQLLGVMTVTAMPLVTSHHVGLALAEMGEVVAFLDMVMCSSGRPIENIVSFGESWSTGTVLPVTGTKRYIILDVYSGFQSWKPLLRQRKYQRFRDVTVDQAAVFRTETLTLHTDVVVTAGEDATCPWELLQLICAKAGVCLADVVLVWFSVPCDTFGRCDSSNQTRGFNHREHAPEMWDASGAGLLQGCREPVTELARQHNKLLELTLATMELLWVLFAIPSILENPHANMRLVPPMRAFAQRLEVHTHTVNYCVYGHPYCKLTDLWTTIPHLSLMACTGTGRCTQRKHCSNKWGYRSQETGKWRHRYTIGGAASRIYGKGLDVEWWKNKVPARLLREVLDAAVGYWGCQEVAR